MNRAIENILERFYNAEEKDFIENFDSDEDFMEQLVKHTIYDLVVLMNHGNNENVLAWIEVFREENDMESDCEESV